MSLALFKILPFHFHPERAIYLVQDFLPNFEVFKVWQKIKKYKKLIKVYKINKREVLIRAGGQIFFQKKLSPGEGGGGMSIRDLRVAEQFPNKSVFIKTVSVLSSNLQSMFFIVLRRVCLSSLHTAQWKT